MSEYFSNIFLTSLLFTICFSLGSGGFDTHVLHQVFDWIRLHYTHRGTHYELLYAARFLVTAANVVTEAFACLVGISGGFHSGSD